MANINGNNMDDLFRQASDQYPLRTDSSDWGKLASALEADPSQISPQVNEQDDKRKRRRILWLFLPLIAGGIGYYTWPASHAALKNSMISAPLHGNAPAQINEGTDRQNTIYAKEVPSNKATVANDNGAGGAVAAVVKTGAGTETGDLSSPAVTTKSDKQAAGNENPIVGKLRDQNGSGRERTNANPTGRDLTPAGRRPTPGKNSANPNENNANDGNYVDQVAGSTNQDASTSGNGIRKPGSEISPDAQYSKVNGPGSLAKGNISVQADVRSKWPASPETQVKAAVKDPKSPHKHSLYVGILGAPDLSTIDFQKIKSVGTTYGILGGYTFNQTWSLETGVYLDKKKYFTDGQYFSKKNVPALQYIELQNVDGTCNMVEIPLNLRYNLSQGKQHKFFATAGLSTYLMSKEWYAYQVWTSSGPANKPFTYTNPYHYLFSIVNMSIGYEQKLGKIGDLRIEPYLRIPLSGIGTGSLSILSAGLNLGITRRIW